MFTDLNTAGGTENTCQGILFFCGIVMKKLRQLLRKIRHFKQSAIFIDINNYTKLQKRNKYYVPLIKKEVGIFGAT